MAEKLVKKCGISYEEAANVLKEADFDMLEAMIILERRGKLGDAGYARYSTVIAPVARDRSHTAADAESFGEFIRIAWRNICNVCGNILKYQVVVARNGRELIYFPLLLAVLLICFTGGLAFAVALVALINGCSFSIRKI